MIELWSWQCFACRVGGDGQKGGDDHRRDTGHRVWFDPFPSRYTEGVDMAARKVARKKAGSTKKAAARSTKKSAAPVKRRARKRTVTTESMKAVTEVKKEAAQKPQPKKRPAAANGSVKLRGRRGAAVEHLQSGLNVEDTAVKLNEEFGENTSSHRSVARWVVKNILGG
jgi:hypothetical protein